MYTPDAHHSIQVIGNEYVDDWITFDLNQDELKLLEALQIPLNKAVLLYSIYSVSDIIHKIVFEFHDAYNPYKNDIMQLFMQLLFFRVTQQIYMQIPLHSETKINREKFSYLLKIRNEIYSSPNKDYKIDALAKKSFMSKSYFQYLYKETFFQKGF